jgi:hypothetical protein
MIANKSCGSVAKVKYLGRKLTVKIALYETIRGD